MGSGQSRSQDPPPEELRLSQDAKKIKDIAHVLDVKAKSQNPLLQQEEINWDQHEQDKVRHRDTARCQGVKSAGRVPNSLSVSWTGCIVFTDYPVGRHPFPFLTDKTLQHYVGNTA